LKNLTNENFLIFAARHYDNPNCESTAEFQEDLMRFKYIKKLITRYIENGDLKERLILNHLIVLSNVFKPDVLCRIIWFKMPEMLPYIKPFLMFLSILPERIYYDQTVIDTGEGQLDQNIVNVLRTI